MFEVVTRVNDMFIALTGGIEISLVTKNRGHLWRMPKCH